MSLAMNYKNKVDDIVKKFWLNLNDMLELFEEIIDVCYDNKLTKIKPIFITLTKNALNNCMYQMDGAPTDIDGYRAMFLKTFALKTYPIWDKIHKRDEKYFAEIFVDIFIDGKETDEKSSSNVDESNILSGFLIQYAKDFYKLFTTDDCISKDDKTALWGYILRLTQQACEFVYWNRNPNLETGKFRIKFLPEINHLSDWVQRWQLIKA